jgi:hypothetical protein
MKEQALDVRVIGSTVKIEICRKVEKTFRVKDSDSLSVIYARALEESVRGVELTEDDFAAIASEIAENRRKREAKRANEAKNR